MSMASPPAHSTWAGVVKGQPPPVVSPGPSPPAARLLQLYRDCVARGTWARLCFETKGGEEELSFSCRVGGAATGATKYYLRNNRKKHTWRLRTNLSRTERPHFGQVTRGLLAAFIITGCVLLRFLTLRSGQILNKNILR